MSFAEAEKPSLRSIEQKPNDIVADARSATLFLLANVAAGVLNYSFQLIASRQLSANDFSELNGWFAELALFFMFGGILQYASNFFPASDKTLKRTIVAFNLFCGG